MKKIKMIAKFFLGGNKAQTNSNSYKKIKPDTIKSATPHSVLRILLWILIAFLILRGVASLFGKTTSESIGITVQQKLTANKKQDQIKTEAAAFAEGFSEEYMTYKGNDTEEYQERLSKYLSSYASALEPSISGNCDVQAIRATAIKCSFYSTNQVNVDVRVKVKYSQSTKDIFLRVPVIENGGKYTIEDLPMVIPAQEIAALDVNNYSGTAATDNETSEIKKMLQNFLQTYCRGNDTELNYFMSDSSTKIKGLKGSFNFKSIDDVKVFYMKDKNSYLVLCSYTITDINSNQDFKQDIHVHVTKQDGRYYVKDIDTRSIDLNNEGGK